MANAAETLRERNEAREKAEKARRMIERLADRIGEMELDCDYEVYEELLKIQYALS